MGMESEIVEFRVVGKAEGGRNVGISWTLWDVVWVVVGGIWVCDVVEIEMMMEEEIGVRGFVVVEDLKGEG